MSGEAVDTHAVVSHTDDSGRTLSGVGVSADRLADTMERHAPADPAPAKAADPSAAPTDAPAPPVSRGRQRFADLTRDRDAALAEAKVAKEERERLAAEFEAVKAKLAAPAAEPAKPAEPEKAVAFTPTRPEPTEDEIGTKYDTYAAFARDLAKWVLEQERAQEAPIEQRVREALLRERAEQDFVSQARAAQDRGRKAYPDFDSLLKSSAGRIPMGRTDQEAMDRARFIIAHPQSEHIQHAILKDEAFARKLQQSSDVEFGVLVAGLLQVEKPKAPAWTPPPPPHPSVGASSPVTPMPSGELAKKGFDYDASGYREKRAAERGLKSSRWR